MDHDKPENPFTPINSIEEEPAAPEGYRSPNFAVVEGMIEDGLRNSVANGDAWIKVEVDGKQKLLGQFLSGDLYKKYGLRAEERAELLERFGNAKIVGGEITYPAQPEVDLGHVATKAVDEYDFRERQAGEHLDND